MTARFWWQEFGNGEDDMLTKVKQYVKEQNMIEWGDCLVVGVSGGADSVALLLALKEMQQQYGLKLYAVHVHHGIRQEADADAQYVWELCELLEIPFSLYRTDIPALAKEQGLTEEEMGRVYRYQRFAEVMNQVGADKVVVAHHMDDQAETVLFHLVRGSKLSGMEGMRPVFEMEVNGKKLIVIRPLLSCRKAEIITWLERRNVRWQDDVTNSDNAYARNAIRNQVVPVLQRVNSKAVEHVAEYACEMQEIQDFIRCQVQEYMREHILMKGKVISDKELAWAETGLVSEDEGICCQVNRIHLVRQHAVLARAVLYEMLCLMSGGRKNIGSVHVQALYNLLGNQTGKRLSLPFGVEAEVRYEMLIIRKSLQREDVSIVSGDDICFRWNMEDMLQWEQGQKTIELSGKGVLKLQICQRNQCDEKQWKDILFMAQNSKNNYTKYFECDTIKDALCLRATEKNDYFVMNDFGAKKKLSRYFIDAKIPADERKNVLVLALNQEVLWMLPMRRCEAYKVTKESQIVLVVEYKGE